MLLMILMLALLAGIVRIGIRLAWGLTKFIFGLGLFWICPVLFIVAVLFGAFSHTWFLILLVGLFCGNRFAHA